MTNANTTQLETDIAIVGGGMVGGVLAWSLAASGLQVALVDRATLADAATRAGERSTALSWGSRQLLDSVGLWADIAADAAAIKRIHVSQQGHLGAVRMAASDHHIDALGYVVRNTRVSACLAKRLPNVDNLKLLTPTQVVSIEQSQRGVQLQLDTGQVLRTKLLVIADGGDSKTRAMAGLSAEVDDYEQHAVVATLSSKNTPADMAWERFTANGPMALLPIGPDLLSLVYTVPSDRLDELLALDDKAFLAKVQAGIGQRPGRLVATSKRQAFPLQRVSVNPSWQGRVVLLGNAARTLHPVAGQGFNLALRDAMTLAELLQGLALNQDAGADFIREQYLAHRKADQRETTALTDVLARTFKGQSSLLGHLRSAGLIATDRLPALRQGFARRSMGLAHRVPKVTEPFV